KDSRTGIEKSTWHSVHQFYTGNLCESAAPVDHVCTVVFYLQGQAYHRSDDDHAVLLFLHLRAAAGVGQYYSQLSRGPGFAGEYAGAAAQAGRATAGASGAYSLHRATALRSSELPAPVSP